MMNASPRCRCGAILDYRHKHCRDCRRQHADYVRAQRAADKLRRQATDPLSESSIVCGYLAEAA